MERNPFVTVIVPNYNYARFLKQRIDSILSQTYQNIEIILIDDCSSDNSRDILEQYRHNRRVKTIIYNKRNSGSPFHQWEKGIELASGDLIWIAESDDYAEPTFLESLVAKFKDDTCSPLAFAYCDLTIVNDKNVKDDTLTINHCHNQPSTVYVYDGESFIRERLVRMCCVCNASSVLFSKAIAVTISKKYSKFRTAGDYLFWIMMAERGNVSKVDSQLCYNRRHNNSQTEHCNNDGTLSIENLRILKYLYRHRHISLHDAFKLYLEKLYILEHCTDYSVSARRRVLRTWNPLRIMNKYTIALCWKIIK